jgi:hypothetical protein
MKTWLKKLKRQWSIDSVIICTQRELSAVPPLPQNRQIVVREMDTSDPVDVSWWLAIHNDAFSRQWTATDFQQNVVDHPHLLITQTYFLVIEREPIGALSVGAFRRNQNVGIGHYMSLKKRWHGKGLGKYLILLKLNSLKNLGMTFAESETTLIRRESIYLHFSSGFHPKNGLDQWNTPDVSVRPIRILAWRKFHRMYREWSS